MNNVYTENMADIMACYRERKLVQEIITVWNEDGLPDDFYNEGVKFAFNRNSGFVFLTNDDYQALMINDDTGKLELWLNSPYEGREGFYNDLLADYQEDPELWHSEDVEWLEDMAQ